MKIDFQDSDHKNPTDCQLFLALTGSKEGVYSSLLSLLAEFHDDYGKPRQGTYINCDCPTQVITPKWNGTNYK